MQEQEKRTFNQTFEIRASDDTGDHVISGYAIVFNQPSEYMGFVETIDPGALEDVDLSKVFCLYNHDFSNVLARTDTKTLTLSIDKRGLAFTCQLPETTLGNDVFENVRNGNVQGMSFGFTVEKDQWSEDSEGNTTRTILKFDRITEVSLTCIPAYPETSVAAQRSYERYKRSQEKERFLLWLDLTEKENKMQ
ncbi:HK97 family phage prohead protease [Sporolactobacillus sp. CQH2019]|uniref:HK97 family phage prohead protease n=1 Tax=Sporolactobacillus sp. CQH2019 TaxID=3023512 RepID=UPI0023679EAF|nr:HK97 family phage prohead protease [Sporolactobacillus sp. CQH2019]MDD9149330.1 HK97 family phage prohead protease [Sporolactobacillus sp. CQH2019]